MADQDRNTSASGDSQFTSGPDGYQDGVTYEIHRPERNLIQSLSLDEFANWDGRHEIALVGPAKVNPKG